MLVFRLALRALRWRAAASATVFVVALIGILAATVGPIYLHAVNETVLTERLTQAPQSQRDVHVTRATLIGTSGVQWETPVRTLAQQAADKRWFDAPVYSEEAQIDYQNPGRHQLRYAGRLAAIDDLCKHLRFVSGRCTGEDAVRETVISARTAVAEHLAVGDLIKPVPVAGVVPIALRIVGIYRPVDEHGSFWEPWHYFDAAGTIFDNQLPRLDSFFVSHRTLRDHVVDAAQTIAADVHLRPADVHLDDLPALRATVKDVQATAAGAQIKLVLSPTIVGSQLGDVLDGMQREMSLARTLIILPTAQLSLLAIFVLYAVVAGTTSVQGPEVALAKLRGRRPRSVLLQGVLQPIVMILIAAPAAAALAWLTVALVGDRLLGQHVSVAFPASAVGVAALAATGGILAAVVAARRIVVAPVSALLRRGGDTSGASTGLALADAAAVTLALAGLIQLIAGGVLESGKTDPLSAVAPTLLAVAASIVVLRLLPYAGRAVVRWTRESSRLATYLAVRQIVRRPAGARVLVLVGVALALASFAVTNWSVARTNREGRALNQAGAATVLDVTVGPGVRDLRTAVDQADPGGQAMAVEVVQTNRSTPLLAVDSARFPGIGAWQSGYSSKSLRDVLATLTPKQPAPVAFTGGALRFTVDVSKEPKGAADLTVAFVGQDHRLHTSTFGPVRRGHSTFVEDVRPSCDVPCRITSLALVPRQDSHVFNSDVGLPKIVADLAADVRTNSGWHRVTGFENPTRWRDDGEARATLTKAGAALGLNLQQNALDGPWPTLRSQAVPGHLPAVLASTTYGAYPGESVHDASAVGLDLQPLPIDGLIESVTLPQLDRIGAMVDLGLAQQAMTSPASSGTNYQVWLSPSAPKDLPSRLAAHGVRVVKTTRAKTFQVVLDHTGPAFADGLFLVAAAAATLLAIGATVLGGIITARRRAYELAALEATGVAPRTLRRATAAEQGILLAAGLVVGLAAGLGGSVLALPTTPFFVDETVGPPVAHELPLGLLAVLVAGLVVVFVLTCVVVARLVSRQATAGRLREAQQ